MTLASAVQARYAGPKLTRLTNPEKRSATTTDTTRLDFACTDAVAEFFRRTSVVFDDTNDQHVDVAVELVILKLMERGGASAASTSQHRDRVEKQFESLALVLGRDKPEATSTGGDLSVTDEVPGGTSVYPKFDRHYIGDFLPNPPGVGSQGA